MVTPVPYAAPPGYGTLDKNVKLIAPQGSSVSQEQIDLLMQYGMKDGIITLCKFPSQMSQPLVGMLLAAEPAGRKIMLNKIVREAHTHAVDTQTKGFYEMSKEELEKKTKMMKKAAEAEADDWRWHQKLLKMAKPALEWLKSHPPAKEWTANRLYVTVDLLSEDDGLNFGIELLTGMTNPDDPFDPTWADGKQRLLAMFPTFVMHKEKYMVDSNIAATDVELQYKGVSFVIPVLTAHLFSLDWPEEDLHLLPVKQTFTGYDARKALKAALFGKPKLPTPMLPTVHEVCAFLCTRVQPKLTSRSPSCPADDRIDLRRLCLPVPRAA